MLYSLIKKIHHNFIFIVKHKLLPKGLLARFIMILVVPMMLALILLGYIFYDNHWDKVGKRLATSITGEISGIIDLLDDFGSFEDQQKIIKTASNNFSLNVKIIPNSKIYPAMEKIKQNWITDELKISLDSSLAEKNKFYIDEVSEAPSIMVYLQYYSNVLKIEIPYKRFFSSTAYVFVLWMVASLVLLFSIASIFMKNQVRSIIKLAEAADEFGKGRDLNFKISGASEIKKAGRAFLKMKNRIKRHLSERTYMLAGVSHDLRTPLTRMNLQLALIENEENKTAINSLKLDVKEMETMVDAYISFVKGEGSEPYTLVSLPEMIQEVINRFEINTRKITFESNVDFSMKLRKNAIIRCLNNVISNALRHAEKINITLDFEENKLAIITIDDDGPGIEEEKFEEVFRAFYRIENSRNVKTGGIGLGLTVSRDIINAHGGEINLANSPLGGLQVIIKLPL